VPKPKPPAPANRLTTATTPSSSAGTASTQWCDHEIGDTSRAARALSDSAHASAPRSSAGRMPRQAATTATADSASQAAIPAGECGSSPARASTPWMDWLAA